jgi:hypothetical protein
MREPPDVAAARRHTRPAETQALPLVAALVLPRQAARHLRRENMLRVREGDILMNPTIRCAAHEERRRHTQRLADQAKEAADLAELAFADGNPAIGIAALSLAAQLVQLAKISERAPLAEMAEAGL